MLNTARTQGWMDAQRGWPPNPKRYGFSGDSYREYMDGYTAYKDNRHNREAAE